METEDFLRVINECDFIREDIVEIKDQIQLTKAENSKITRAVSNIEKAQKILTELFPMIQSLDHDVRADLEAELAELYC